jgi:hypothetical protein
LFRPDAMLRRTDLQHRVPTVGSAAHLSGSKVEPWLRP